MDLQGGPSFHKYSSALKSITILKDERLSTMNGLQVLEQLLTYILTTSVTTPSNPVLMQVVTEIRQSKERLQQIVCYEILF